MEKSFLKYIKNERRNFVNEMNKQKWNTKMRTSAERLLIAYGQMADKLEDAHTQMLTQEEVEKILHGTLFAKQVTFFGVPSIEITGLKQAAGKIINVVEFDKIFKKLRNENN